jgi:outer membrane protein TolC
VNGQIVGIGWIFAVISIVGGISDVLAALLLPITKKGLTFLGGRAMLQTFRPGAIFAAALAAILLCTSGCTSFRDYVHNGYKVGPNYCKPAAPVAETWIDGRNVNEGQRDDLSKWWLNFRDPVLNEPDPVLNYLIHNAYQQNLTLRQAGTRVLQSRALLAIAVGNIFPQTQTVSGEFNRSAIAVPPASTAAKFASNWQLGFNLNWELDFWGQFRRAIASADDNLDASVENYDAAIVTLLGDVATNYVRVRTDQEQIRLLKKNEVSQRWVYEYYKKRYGGGRMGYGTDVRVSMDQALGLLRQTQSQIPQLEIDLRQANDALCVLLGMPVIDLREEIPVWKSVDGPKMKTETEEREFRQQLLDQEGPLKAEDLQRIAKIVNLIYIPTVPGPKEVGVGIPADLLRRRPDVRQAERVAAAQSEQIGIAQSLMYPAFTINGSLGYSAQNFPDLFRYQSLTGNVGPQFNWNVLNYGRIVNNVHLQDAKFQELVYAYQNIVLTADQEVEDGLVTYLRSHQVAKLLEQGVVGLTDAVAYMTLRKGAGVIDGNAWAVTAQNLVAQEVSWAQIYGNIPKGLIAVYRALGGGWEIRLSDNNSETPIAEALPAGGSDASKSREGVPAPMPASAGEIKQPTEAPRPATPAASAAADLPPAPDMSNLPPLSEALDAPVPHP